MRTSWGPPSRIGKNGRVTPGLWRNLGDRAAVWPGSNHPLGATWSAEATNFAVHAPRADAVWVCVFDEDGAETRHELTEQSLGIWHGAVPGVPGVRVKSLPLSSVSVPVALRWSAVDADVAGAAVFS